MIVSDFAVDAWKNDTIRYIHHEGTRCGLLPFSFPYRVLYSVCPCTRTRLNISSRQFHRDFRNQALLGLVQDRFPKSKLAYLVVKVMLDNSSPTERKVDEQVSASIRWGEEVECTEEYS